MMVKTLDGIRNESLKTIGTGDFFRLSCAEIILCYISRVFFLLVNNIK